VLSGALLLIGLAGSCGVGCAGEAGPPEPESAKKLGLSPWQGPEKELFADEIDPAALGFVPPKAPRRDPAMWARAQKAEIVGRVKVQTVTVENRLGDLTFKLGLRFATPLLAATELEERDFEVTVEPRDPSYGIVRALDTGLQGRTFVGFVRRFAGADDQVDVHFYLAPDSADVAAAVQEAVAVQEVSRR
jgi:hypothetical protein